MKKIVYLAVMIAVGTLIVALTLHAQNPAPPKYEYAIVKWDGPDRLFYNLPGKFEWVHLEQKGTSIPRDAQNEEYCLAVGANIMAKDGWEPIAFDSRRILFRRAK
jgi:hypothetical protein